MLMDDGTQSVFGRNTLVSLWSTAEEDGDRWLNSLTNIEMQGLVHEIGQQLLESSSIYTFYQSKLEKISDRANYAYFGLAEDATDKDLDNAYRKLAKQMHPDKNGGTESAKKQFQKMKDRYEALKQRRNPSQEEAGKDGGNGKQDADGHEAEDETRQKEAYDEDKPAAAGDDESDGVIEYDPSDRAGLGKAAWKMLRQLQTLEKSTEAVVAQLKMCSA